MFESDKTILAVYKSLDDENSGARGNEMQTAAESTAHGSTQESACEQTGQGRDSQVRWRSVLERDKAALDVRGQQALPADSSVGQREQQGRGRCRGMTGEQ